MDENLVVHAIQWKGNITFERRYSAYLTEKERDDNFKFITKGMDEESIDQVARVKMTIRVKSAEPIEGDDANG